MIEVQYKRGSWHNGQICFEVPYVDGKKHGIEKWFRMDGTREIELTFKDGVKHGEARTWHPNGVLENYVMFHNGTKVGLDVKYDEYGDYTNITKY
jgi:antitoxin component YwqK of YwqJK toxin-antitoxin module